MAFFKENTDTGPAEIGDAGSADRVSLAGFWLAVIQPMLEAAQAKTVVEVGAEKGRNTVNLLSYCAQQQGHLHIVDPLPEVDVEAFRRQFGPTFTLHRDLSLNVLPQLGQFDAILLDGDHNWYTVYHELKQIEAAHRANPATYPLIFLHDVEWPYARRDMYYQPDTIPAEYRQPYAQLGILPGLGLSWGNGLNSHHNNAELEGGKKKRRFNRRGRFSGRNRA